MSIQLSPQNILQRQLEEQFQKDSLNTPLSVTIKRICAAVAKAFADKTLSEHALTEDEGEIADDVQNVLITQVSIEALDFWRPVTRKLQAIAQLPRETTSEPQARPEKTANAATSRILLYLQERFKTSMPYYQEQGFLEAAVNIFKDSTILDPNLIKTAAVMSLLKEDAPALISLAIDACMAKRGKTIDQQTSIIIALSISKALLEYDPAAKRSDRAIHFISTRSNANGYEVVEASFPKIGSTCVTLSISYEPISQWPGALAAINAAKCIASHMGLQYVDEKNNVVTCSPFPGGFIAVELHRNCSPNQVICLSSTVVDKTHAQMDAENRAKGTGLPLILPQ